jgi:hypothetical protein
MGGGRLHGASHESGGAMDGVRGRRRGTELATEHRTGAAGHGLEEMDTDDTDTTVSADGKQHTNLAEQKPGRGGWGLGSKEHRTRGGS